MPDNVVNVILIINIFVVLFVSFLVLNKISDFLRYYSSPYFWSTHKMRWQLKRDKGSLGEYKIYKELCKLNGEKHFFFNLYIPRTNGTTSEIDLLMVHKSGLYVFESKNYKGTIYGDEHSQNWCQFFTQSKKYSFYNPIIQNQSHINAIKSILGKDCPCYNIVVFSDEAVLKNHIQHDDLAVIQLAELVRTCRRIARKNRHAKFDLRNAVKLLYPHKKSTRIMRRKHKKNVTKLKEGKGKWKKKR